MRALWTLGGTLLFLLACRPPAPPPPPPTWEGVVAQASSALAEARKLDPKDREDFFDGFRHGSGMVHNAVVEGRTPYRISLTFTPRPGLPKGKLPDGAVLKLPTPVVEQDSETGWPWAQVMGGQGIWGQGAVAGFDWALDHEGEALRRLGLRRPRPVPTLPEPRAWRPVGESITEFTLRGDLIEYKVARQGGTLMWLASGRGFAPTRGWVPALDLPFSHAAPGQDALWLALTSGDAVALDRDTGWVRAVQAAPKDLPKALLPEARGTEGPVPRDPRSEAAMEGDRKAAEAGDGDAMVRHAWDLLQKSKPAEGLKWMQKAAEKGKAQAMVHLAMAHFMGQFGLPKDKAEARRWMEKAAQLGDPQAKLGLEMLYRDK